MNPLSLQPIGILHSCFKQKFGTPRQSGLVPKASGQLELLPPYNRDEAVRGLEDFSHLWLIFVFHQAIQDDWKPMVRPPRLGGNQRIGVFASRSPFRPNPIGLSAVKLNGIRREQSRLLLDLSGIDLVDGTPILDIKPYVPYADSLTEAHGGFADQAPAADTPVRFAEDCFQSGYADPLEKQQLYQLITQVLAQDPRPAYINNADNERVFGMQMLDYEVRWRMQEGCAQVIRISRRT